MPSFRPPRTAIELLAWRFIAVCDVALWLLMWAVILVVVAAVCALVWFLAVGAVQVNMYMARSIRRWLAEPCAPHTFECTYRREEGIASAVVASAEVGAVIGALYMVAWRFLARRGVASDAK